MDTPAGTHAISENTQVRAPLGRTIAIAAGLAVTCVGIGIGYATLKGRIETLAAAVEAHKNDPNVHLESLYHMGHGRPVGNFDFTQVTQRIEAKLDKVEAKQATVICRPRSGGGMICEPKENP